jgi:hypothetical protein
MREIRYDDLNELEVAMVEQVRAYERGRLATGIEDLPKRWTSVVDHKGNYFEGL